MARLPQAPFIIDIESIHQSMQDIVRFLRQTFNDGAKHPEFTQDQIDSFIDESFLGTILFNSDTQESNVSYLDTGVVPAVVKWRSI